MDLRSAADELYACSPAEFTSRRSELVAAAKAAGKPELARQLSGLRKPVTTAWLVNRLVRANAPELAQLSELGRRLRQAHQTLDGAKLRELSTRRQALIIGMVSRAAEVSGVAVTDAVSSQLQQTFEAAIADADAEAAVLSGQLTTALFYSGFGPVDLSDATAVPVRHLQLVPPPGPRARRPRAPKSAANAGDQRNAAELTRARLAAELAQARSADEQAAAAELDAERRAADAETALGQAQAVYDRLLKDVERLEDQLRQARHSLIEADSALTTARSGIGPAQRAARHAKDHKRESGRKLSEISRRSDRAGD